jgi:hypothetical protein
MQGWHGTLGLTDLGSRLAAGPAGSVRSVAEWGAAVLTTARAHVEQGGHR